MEPADTKTVAEQVVENPKTVEQMAQDAQDLSPWNCPACTFKNMPSASTCEVCSSPRES